MVSDDVNDVGAGWSKSSTSMFSYISLINKSNKFRLSIKLSLTTEWCLNHLWRTNLVALLSTDVELLEWLILDQIKIDFGEVDIIISTVWN